MKLSLRKISDPRNTNRKIQFFCNTDKALTHIRNHILTSPECNGWDILFKYMKKSPPLNLQISDERFKFAKGCMKSKKIERELQLLYEMYSELSNMASVEANKMKWFLSMGNVTFAIGLCGIVLIIKDSCIVSSFLPRGFFYKGKVVENPHSPLPREGIFTETKPWKKPLSRKEKIAEEKRKRKWSDEEKLYYLVFKPSVKSVRRGYYDSFNILKKREIHYSCLKKILPPMSKMGFKEWKEDKESIKRM